MIIDPNAEFIQEELERKFGFESVTIGSKMLPRSTHTSVGEFFTTETAAYIADQITARVRL